MKKIKKYIEFCTTKIIQFFQERKFTFEGVDLKYLFKSCSTSDTLIVVFSACTRAGIKARYNYVRTLKGINANCLFILDDFGEDRRGAYYLGKNCGDEIEIATKKLISDIYSSCKAKKLLFCGSSKGGWAALNFMTSFPESIAIVGAPQYNLGNYLMAPALVNTRNYVLPEPNEEKMYICIIQIKNIPMKNMYAF